MYFVQAGLPWKQSSLASEFGLMIQKLDMNCQRQYPQFFYLQMHAVCRMQYGVQGDATLNLLYAI